ncbi:hypothetical protein D3C87_2157620 [compost metagenome]
MERPRAVTIMPRVAMKGGIFVRAISCPLMKPAKAPARMPTASGMKKGRSVRPG